MIYANEKKVLLTLPKLTTCDISYNRMYQLVVQNTYTKQAWMYKVRDTEQFNKLRYSIGFEFLDEMNCGTYQYYLLPDGEWATLDINPDNVRNSSLMIENKAIQYNGSYLIANGKLLVTNTVDVAILDHNLTFYERDGVAISTTIKLNDKSCEGDVYSYIRVLQTGLIKYEPYKLLDERTPEFSDRQTYKEFTERN